MAKTYYGVLLDSYWTGKTGQAIQKQGGKDATILGAYLVSCKNANMIGLYRLPLADIAHETPLKKAAGIEAAFEVLAAVNYARYDAASEHVWVVEMATYRLGLADGPLDIQDKRAIGAAKLYERADDNPFLRPFYDKYKSLIHLKKPRGSPSRGPTPGPSKGLRRGFQGASKGLGSQITDHRSQISGIRSQVQTTGVQVPGSGFSDQGKAPPEQAPAAQAPPLARRDAFTLASSRPRDEATSAQACVLMREAYLLGQGDGDTSWPNVKERYVAICAAHGFAFDPAQASDAFDRVEAAAKKKAVS